MKKVVAVFAVLVFAFGFIGCTPEDQSKEDTLYEVSTGKDETPSGGDKGDN